MKVIINVCYGGFGLSEEAFELLLNKKGIEFDRVPSKHPIREDKYDYYRKGHIDEDAHFLWYHQFSQDRADPDLIAVVEELGERANGWASELKIVEIPDDVQFHIHEYDGMEHVAENHRTWS
jgi:hypothetical protein